MTRTQEIMKKFEEKKKQQNLKLIKNLIKDDWIFENNPIIKEDEENKNMTFQMHLKNELEMADIYGISHSELIKLREEIRK